MAKLFSRQLILVTENIEKHYRYRDQFQIIGLDDSHPKPPKESFGHFPVLLEYFVDIDDAEKFTLIKDMDVEAHEQIKEGLTISSYHSNKVHEIKVLLTLFTHSLFLEYNINTQELAWFTSFSDHRSPGTHWGQKLYSPGELNLDNSEEFSTLSSPPIPLTPASEYYRRRFFRFPGQKSAGEEFTLPDNIDHLLDKYYSLKVDARQAFYHATNLYYQAMRIWDGSQSLTYAALISSIETLISFDHRSDRHIPCSTCGGTQYHVMRNFRSFLGVDDATTDFLHKKAVNELYNMRSKILHSGYLLLTDLHQPGHYLMRESEEFVRLRSVVNIVKTRLINWLLEQ